MFHFHTSVFTGPSATIVGPSVQLRGARFSALHAPAGGPPIFDRPLARSFEQIQQSLLAIPRMDIEPDGYFLVTGGEQGGERWQIDGHLFEYEGQMHRIEIHGCCKEVTLDALLDALGGGPHVFQLVREGVTLSDDDFRRYAQLPSE